MKKARFTETQIIGILKEADAGTPVKEICRTHGISDATYYNWKSKYGGMSASDLKRLKEMERELSQLKRMYADMAMENRALKDLIEKNSRATREARSGDLSGGRAPAFCSAKLPIRRIIPGSVLQPPTRPRRRCRGYRRH
jgi:putative transposase